MEILLWQPLEISLSHLNINTAELFVDHVEMSLQHSPTLKQG